MDPKSNDKQKNVQPGNMFALGIGMGVALGAGIGVAIENIAIGIGIGAAVGAAVGVYLEQRSKDSDANK